MSITVYVNDHNERARVHCNDCDRLPQGGGGGGSFEGIDILIVMMKLGIG